MESRLVLKYINSNGFNHNNNKDNLDEAKLMKELAENQNKIIEQELILTCGEAASIRIGKTIQGNTTSGKNNASSYNNDPWWQSTGPEGVHKMEWQGGQLTIKLSNKSAALDLLLLRSCDNNDFLDSCGG